MTKLRSNYTYTHRAIFELRWERRPTFLRWFYECADELLKSDIKLGGLDIANDSFTFTGSDETRSQVITVSVERLSMDVEGESSLADIQSLLLSIMPTILRHSGKQEYDRIGLRQIRIESGQPKGAVLNRVIHNLFSENMAWIDKKDYNQATDIATIIEMFSDPNHQGRIQFGPWATQNLIYFRNPSHPKLRNLKDAMLYDCDYATLQPDTNITSSELLAEWLQQAVQISADREELIKASLRRVRE